MNVIAQRFDRAAQDYDQAAPMQAQVAQQLIQRVTPSTPPQQILDIGCGTGMVTEILAQRWPTATLTALDHAPAMLQQAQRKIPHLQTIIADAAHVDLEPHYDLIFSSMMLHWLPDPVAALRLWQRGLKPHGQLHVALLSEGSFQEWRDLCQASHMTDGLWKMPCTDFAQNLEARAEQQTLTLSYPSARVFLQRLKTIGAATPSPDHTPLGVASMRRLLQQSPQPFAVTFQIIYIEMQSLDSV